MNNREMVQAEAEWRERIDGLKALIQQLKEELVEAEAELTELLAALNAFEFRLRAGVDSLMRRLEKLSDEVEELRRQLRHNYNDFGDFEAGEWSYQSVEDAYHEPGIDYESYRYHQAPVEPLVAPLAKEQRAELRKLYRQLARRFHPDMGSHEADREYRNNMMIAINAAYAARDLDRLRELANEPDLVSLVEPLDDGELLLEFLLKELASLQRRLAETHEEIKALSQKKNFKLMKKAQRAEASGRDWLAEMKEQLQEKIRQRMAERDVLQQEIDMLDNDQEEGAGLHGDAFADAVWNMTLETAYDSDPDFAAQDWLSRRQNGRYWYDDDPDEMEEWEV